MSILIIEEPSILPVLRSGTPEQIYNLHLRVLPVLPAVFREVPPISYTKCVHHDRNARWSFLQSRQKCLQTTNEQRPSCIRNQFSRRFCFDPRQGVRSSGDLPRRNGTHPEENRITPSICSNNSCGHLRLPGGTLLHDCLWGMRFKMMFWTLSIT